MPEPEAATRIETAGKDAPKTWRGRTDKAAATGAALAAADAVPSDVVPPTRASAPQTDDPLAPVEQAVAGPAEDVAPAEAEMAPGPEAPEPAVEPVAPPVVSAPVVVPVAPPFPVVVPPTPPPPPVASVVPIPAPVEEPPPTAATPAPWLIAGGAAAAGAAGAAGGTPAFTPPLDPAALEPEATIEVVRSAPPTGPIDTPWAKTETERTEIQTVRPPEEIVRPAGPAGIVCSACGTENEQSRRFCKSCGTLLVAPVPTPVVRATPKTRSFRLILLAPILLAAGLLGFGGTVLLKGGLGGSAATAAPSAASSGAAHASAPTTSAPPGAATKQPAAKVAITDAKASSTLGDLPKYAATQAIDGSLSTSWQEGKTTEKGQYIELFVGGPADIESITIWAGSQAASANYSGNLRPHHILVRFDSGPDRPWELKDVFKSQAIGISGHVDSVVRITIVDTYPSKKTALAGSPFDDCAISEIQLNGAP